MARARAARDLEMTLEEKQIFARTWADPDVNRVESIAMSLIVNRPDSEPGFGLVRQETRGRSIRYTVHSYATDRAEGERG